MGDDDQNDPQEKEIQESKVVSQEVLRIAEKIKKEKNTEIIKRRERQSGKGKICPFEFRASKNSQEIRKTSLEINAKK